MFEATFVLLRRSNGDTNPFAEFIARHRPDDDAVALKLLENALAISDTDEDEVGGGRNKFKAEAVKGLRKKAKPSRVIEPCPVNVLPIVQRSEGGSLGKRI